MDRRTIIAVVLLAIFLIFYYPLLRLVGLGKYVEPERPRPVAVSDTLAAGDSLAGGPVAASPAPAAPAGTPPPPAPAAPAAPALGVTPIAAIAGELERSVTLETPLYVARFSNRGARLVAVEVKGYASAHGVTGRSGRPVHHHPAKPVEPGDRVVLAGGPAFGLDLGSAGSRRALDGLVYAVEESLDAAGAARALTFTYADSAGLFVRQTYRVRAGDYALDYAVEIRGVPDAWRVSDYSLITRSWPLVTEADLPADQRQLRATSLVGKNIHREHPGGLQKGPRSFDGNAVWAGVQTRYFLSAVAAVQAVPRGVVSSAELRPLSADEQRALGPGARPMQDVAVNAFVSGLPSASLPVHRYLLYVGPTEYKRLGALGVGFERAVDFGWSWIVPFSRALLQLLEWMYALLRNYGLAIIALATLVRVALHPLNVASMKSMRAMQKVQPEVERLREKYKNDPQAMNAALMALYKEHKVNPAGGCLPLLLQMPLFLALYQVLFNAIELRQAAFVGWMHDLSAPDTLFSVAGFPIRLLPLLMMGSGLLQQKLSPTDPRQAPTMYLMNVVMVVFFYNLPSGLVLYWTVMNLLTALQQWLVLRHDDGPTPAVATAPAAPAAKGRKRR
uniref:Membrane protein insertase YidC n=1 Tax=Eiseniibacteriota bacterium TaxID=2212470 RepID=A0A832IBR3_UNCEI